MPVFTPQEQAILDKAPKTLDEAVTYLNTLAETARRSGSEDQMVAARNHFEALMKDPAAKQAAEASLGVSVETNLELIMRLHQKQDVRDIGFSEQDVAQGYPAFKRQAGKVLNNLEESYRALILAHLSGTLPNTPEIQKILQSHAEPMEMTYRRMAAKAAALQNPTLPRYVVVIDAATNKPTVYRIDPATNQRVVETDPAIVANIMSQHTAAQQQQNQNSPSLEPATQTGALDNGLIGLGYVAAVAGGAAAFYEHNGLIVNVLKEANGDHYFAKTQAGGVGRVFSQKGPKGAITFSHDISFDQAIMGFALAAEKGWKGVRLRGQVDNSDKTMLFIAAQLYNHVEAHAALMSGKHDDMKMETFSKILNDEESGKIRPLEDVNSPGGKFDPSNMTFIGVTPELSAFMSGLQIEARVNPTNKSLPQFYTGEDVKTAIARMHAQLREEVVQHIGRQVQAQVPPPAPTTPQAAQQPAPTAPTGKPRRGLFSGIKTWFASKVEDSIPKGSVPDTANIMTPEEMRKNMAGRPSSQASGPSV